MISVISAWIWWCKLNSIWSSERTFKHGYLQEQWTRWNTKHGFKKCAVGIRDPVTHLFSTSLKRGVFPDLWKTSYVSPIHKSGSNSKVINYRPLTKQPQLPTLLEKLILPVVSKAFNNIIISRQHGFIKGLSTVTNLFAYIDENYIALDQELELQAIYTDLRKAFDTVDQNILL